MREDLPYEEPLPALWSLSLGPGGDTIDEGPHPVLEFAVVQPLLQLGDDHALWQVEDRSGERHVLCETRFVLSERLAVPQLGRLRELMIREARLLDTLSHDYVVPLEQGWLEERAGLEQFHVCARSMRKSQVEGANYTSVSAAQDPIGIERVAHNTRQHRCWGDAASTAVLEECSLRQPHSMGAAMAKTGSAAQGSTVCCGCFRREAGFPPYYAKRDKYSRDEENAAAFLLHSRVPLTLDDIDCEDGGMGGMSHSIKSIDDASTAPPQHGGLEQLRWGGDGTTGWKGTAEPKPSADKTTSCTGCTSSPLPTGQPRPMSLNSAAAASGGYYCGCCGSETRGTGHGGREIVRRQRERTLCLTSYLLLPDWLPLSVWFDTEFEPQTAAPEGQDGAATARAVTAPHDWALVWRHLMSMFEGVLRGVEHVHTKGLVHNNIHPCSLWVAADGRCCVGNLSQVTPPGCRKGAPEHHHYASPERRRGDVVDSHSDVYALGVLMLDFWRHYILSRGLGEVCLTGEGGLVERVKSGEGRAPHPEEGADLLDCVLVGSMLAEDPFDRPDCFEIEDRLGGS
ncbi:unnamed protein product [Ectocarpus sp. CCAP 1310/34]|nr:unnamed protein product [Ectocarpus sp. CCAP 1310/34]